MQSPEHSWIRVLVWHGTNPPILMLVNRKLESWTYIVKRMCHMYNIMNYSDYKMQIKVGAQITHPYLIENNDELYLVKYANNDKSDFYYQNDPIFEWPSIDNCKIWYQLKNSKFKRKANIDNFKSCQKQVLPKIQSSWQSTPNFRQIKVKTETFSSLGSQNNNIIEQINSAKSQCNQKITWTQPQVPPQPPSTKKIDKKSPIDVSPTSKTPVQKTKNTTVWPVFEAKSNKCKTDNPDLWGTCNLGEINKQPFQEFSKLRAEVLTRATERGFFIVCKKETDVVYSHNSKQVSIRCKRSLNGSTTQKAAPCPWQIVFTKSSVSRVWKCHPILNHHNHYLKSESFDKVSLLVKI